jgi:1,5-anhydro-D-fructose reductase (1,5-anhydro-D-mannitol-forming)
VKIAIVSFAHPHAISYARILNDRDDVELLTTDDVEGVVDGGQRGALLAERLGIPYVGSIDELYSWGPDAVIVTSENARHLPHVQQAAAVGAHVLCEKPLATTVDDATRIVEVCAEAGVQLMTAFPTRFADEFTALQKIVDAEALGRVLTISGANNGQVPEGRAWFTDATLAGGGAVTDHTVHIADLLFALFPGETVEEVFATANGLLRPDLEVETAALISLRYSNGVTAVIDCSWSVPDRSPSWGGLSLRVIGENGDASIAPFGLHLDGFSTASQSPRWVDYGKNLDRAMLDEFISALRQDRTPVPCGEDGLRCVEVVAAAYESIRSGRAVPLEEVTARHHQ